MNTLAALAFAASTLSLGGATLLALAAVPSAMKHVDAHYRSRLRHRITSSTAPGRRT